MVKIVAKFQDKFSIHLIRTAERGLSKARNRGIKIAEGDIIAFPDDDCWYPPDTLEKVAFFFENHKEDGITGIPLSPEGRVLVNGFETKKCKVNMKNVWKAGISTAIFLKNRVVKTVGFYDESLGVGSGTPYGSGEETDYLIRALKMGFAITYDPSIKIIHPDKEKEINEAQIISGFSYGAGMGYVLKKHRYSWRFVLKMLIRASGGSVLAFMGGNKSLARKRLNSFRGRWYGILHYSK